MKNLVSLKKSVRYCPHCRRTLVKSDLPEHDFLCRRCDENFYRFETRENCYGE